MDPLDEARLDSTVRSAKEQWWNPVRWGEVAGEAVDTPVARLLKARAEKPVKPVPLPDLSPEGKKELQSLYGPEGEHWEETLPQMLETTEGQQRAKTWRDLVKMDPAYQDRYAHWSKTIQDDDAFWQTVVGEYKESRRKDVNIRPDTVTGAVAQQAALTVATGGLLEIPAIAQGVRAGVPLTKLLRTAAIEGGPTAAARDLSRIGILGGVTGAKAVAAMPKQFGALIGGTAGAVENPEHPFLGFAGGAAAGLAGGAAAAKIGEKLAGTLVDRAATSLGQKLLATAARDPRRWESLLGAGNYPGISMLGGAVGNAAVGLMDETDPEEKALLNAAIGLGIPATAKYLTKIPFPGLGRIGLSMAPTAVGAIAGAMTGNALNPADPEEGETFLGQAVKGAGVGALAATGLAGGAKGLGYSGLGEKLLYGDGGDFHGAGAWLAKIIPLDVVRSLKNPATGELMFAHPVGALQTASDNVAFEVHQETQRVAEALSAIPAKKRTSPDFRRQLFEAMRATGANGTVKDPSQVFHLDDDALQLAHTMRGEFDRLFWEKVTRGEMKPEQYIEGYVPRMIDMRQFRSGLEGTFLRSPTDVRNFRKMVSEEFLASEAAASIANNPDSIVLFNPDQLPKGFGPREAKALQTVFGKAKEYNVFPKSVLEILSSRKPLDAEQINLLGALRGVVGKEEIPENIFDAALLERKKGTNLPTLDDPLQGYLRAVEKNARKRNFGPLIEPIKDVDGKVISPSPLQAALDDMGARFPEHQKVLAEVTKSVMGYPRPIDEALDTVAEVMFKDPESWRVGSRMLKDLTYAGALGMKPAAGIRNLFSYMMTGTALGKDDAISGALIAEKNFDFWRNEALQNRALANEFADELDEIREVLPGTLGYMSEKSRDFARTMLGMQHYTEEKFRTWTNTSAMLKVLRERGNFDPSYLREADRIEVRKLIAAARKAGTDEAWWDAARVVGKKTTDLVAWRYGPAGTGPIPQGRSTKLVSMFTSWPLNYASLLQHWASSGRTQHIVNMGVAASLIDKFAVEALGYTRATGLTSQGEGQEQDVASAIPSGPFDVAVPPIPRAVGGVLQLASGAARNRPGDIREGKMAIRRNLPTMLGAGRGESFWRGMKDAEEGNTPDAMIRLLLGGTPQRERDAE